VCVCVCVCVCVVAKKKTQRWIFGSTHIETCVCLCVFVCIFMLYLRLLQNMLQNIRWWDASQIIPKPLKDSTRLPHVFLSILIPRLELGS